MSDQELPRECKLERYFAKHEFNTRHLLCCSDVEALSMSDVIGMADEECRKLWDNLKLSYTESAGHPLLRQEAAKLHDVDADDVLLIVPQEGIYIAMHCLIDYFRKKFSHSYPHVVAMYPAYQSLYENLSSLHCDIDYWTVKESSEGWTFDMHELRSLLRHDTRLLVVNFPHNPTGFIPKPEDWNEIVELCKERNIFIFSDEMYRLTNNDGSVPLPSACALTEYSMTLCGMSKTFALPGLRIGWLCTKNTQIMESMRAFKDYTTICSAGPSEILALIGLRSKDKIRDRTMNIIRKNLQTLSEFFKEYPDVFDWYAPRAGTTGLLKLKGWILKLGIGGASGFCDELVKKAEVLLLPSSMYDIADDCVRLGFGRVDLEDAIVALRSFLCANKPK